MQILLDYFFVFGLILIKAFSYHPVNLRDEITFKRRYKHKHALMFYSCWIHFRFVSFIKSIILMKTAGPNFIHIFRNFA